MNDARERAEAAARDAVFGVANRNTRLGYIAESLSGPLDAYRDAIREAGAAESAARICTCNPMDPDCPARAALAGELPTTEGHDGS